MGVIITTERLQLREAVLDDAPFFMELMNEPSWREFISKYEITDIESARDHIQDKFIKMYQEHGIGLWVMELLSNQTPIGVCGLLKRDHMDDVDLGYGQLEAYQGKGYVTEAARAAIRYGFSTLKLNQIAGLTDPDNIRSIVILENLGFVFQEILMDPDEKPTNVYTLKSS